MAEPEVREAIEAVSVIRRGTRTLFSAMLPSGSPDVFNRLRLLPFVEAASDGVFLHAAVRDAVATSLEASDPARYRAYRIAAWRQLRDEVRDVSPALLWRYTADILYLLQNPVVREGFFPSGYQPLGVEQARAEDGDAICEIAYGQEPPESAKLLEAWWAARPGVFSVCRDYDGSVSGFLIVGRGWDLPREVLALDPIAAAWAEDIRRTAAAKGTLLLRRLLDRHDGEGNSRSRGPLGVDVKRTYMELRPQLRYIYLCGIEWENLNWCDQLGFREMPGTECEVGGKTYRSYRLDMGPGSVDAWLARLVAAELGIADEATQGRSLLDTDAHEIVLPKGRVALTPLEFGVMRELELKAGRPVSRADLVERVWGYESSATSNVVDTVILALRRKLGDRANMIETVRSVGYRYRP
ncbi:MAG: winged helix-turn-helix domain-containing protein [Tepidiformaceae bacterium]